MRPAANNAAACNNVFDKIRMLINQMVSAGQDIRIAQDALWTEKILEKFPYSIVKNVLITTQSKDEVKIEDIMNELEKEIEAKKFVESRLRNFSKHDHNGEREKYSREQPYKASKACVFCKNANHTSNYCRTVVGINERRDILKKEQLCWKCFADSHKSSECPKKNCSRCKQMHDVSICFVNGPMQKGNSSNDSNKPNSGFQPRNNIPPEPRNPYQNRGERQPWNGNNSSDARNNRSFQGRAIANNACVNSDNAKNQASEAKEQIVLMTAEGSVWNYNTDQFEKVLFFFDTGAQKTLIRERTAQDLALPKQSREMCAMSGIGGHTEMFQSNVVTLKILTAHGMEINMKAQTKPIITNGFSSVHLSMEDKHFLELNELWVCNPRVQGEHQNPHILVGLDYYYHLVPPNSKLLQLPSGLHIAKTIFGPSIHGRGIMPMQTNSSGTHERCSPLSTDPESKQLMQQLTAISEPTEAEMLNKLFELQGLGINPHELTREDTTFSYFQKYSKRIQINNGTVTAPLPLKENVTDLSDNYAVAYRRLISLWKHMQNNKEQQIWYTKTFEEYISTNVVEHADEVNTNSVGCYYMPHSGVWRPAKPKPLRIVFDASSKKCGQLSLNDVVHTGESFVNKIHDILVASRTGKIILLCDIQAAFTQIRLQEEHKDLCRFLWFKKANDPPTRDNIVEYRFTRLPFGLTASPSILNMVILAYLNHKDTDIAREIMDHLYVDNILFRANTTEEALQKYKDSKAIFAEIGMNLREYISNSSEVNAAIPEQDRLQGTKIKFLGVEFNTETDEFQVSTTMAQKDYLTKRDIVSQLNSIYDPIGVVGPLLVKLKSLMRQIYDTTLKWNDRVPAELCHKWKTACREINDVTIKMPRRAANDTDKCHTLWVFCDASKLAIAACAYLQNNDTHAVSQLISGKTRLTPKKTVQTIPKLELLAILIGITLAKTLQSKLRLKIPSISIVSDSEIALAWIKSTRKLPPFVTNQRKRIYQIKQQIEDAKETVVNFYYVPTNYNPADAGTRGLTSYTIRNHDWVRGPRWLETGPNITLLKSVENITEYADSSDWEEPDQPKMTISHPVVSIPNDKLIDTTRYSRYTRLLRTLAVVCKTLSNWVQRCNQKRSTSIATANLTNFSKEMEICSDDIRSAEKMLLASEHRSVSIEELQRRFPHINIFRDENEVIRYESRIRNANLPYDTRSPIYIPNDSDLARLIITKIHNENAHCGKDHVLSLARQKYWIPQPSRAIKKYLKGCVICKRCHGLPFGAPEMPPLPKDRVVITKPFQNVGCDFIGPFDSKEKTKMYVCLYTCLTTRAVHLEVVENMTAVAFLNSFVRFVSRRGVPKLIRTDCGTNFKLGQVVINNLYQNNDIDGYSVMSYSSSEGIKWIFNPPSAPWMGGVWERLVGTVKRCFSKAIGRKKLTFIEMTTAITRIEALINTRPLTKVSLTDLNEIPLRPVDFLQGNLKFALPQASQISDHSDSEYDPELIQTVSQAKQAIAHSETIAAKFWEKWNTEYLTAIRDSHTKKSKTTETHLLQIPTARRNCDR
uniref:Peptidase A2 domain-containing protein n=1 Tax=Haemonchus contortus TaxID=6289 RepID=A0A7I5E795_HAECO